MSYSYSPDPSPLRRDRSPSNSRSLGLGSLSRVAASYANASMLTPPINPLSPDSGNHSGSDYFGSQWQGRTSPSAQPYRSNLPIVPGAGNSFASTAASSNGRSSVAVGGRRKSSVQSTLTNNTSASMATDSPLGFGSSDGDRRKNRKNRPSQKDMLSKALQKANDAVLLDNDSDLDGAVAAYQEACQLLKKVMTRSSVLDDRKKLDSIRKTYKDRILELRGSMALSGNELDESMIELDAEGGYMQDDEGDLHADRYTESDHPALDEDIGVLHDERQLPASPLRNDPLYQPPPRRESLAQTQRTMSDADRGQSRNAWQQGRTGPNIPLTLPRMPAATESVVPAPLSPWRAKSPAFADHMHLQSPPPPLPTQQNLTVNGAADRSHSRQDTQGSTSWLDTIDESGDSHSSVHSRASSLHDGGKRKFLGRQIRASGGTEADFDAALDSAIEAAYNQGFEPAVDGDDVYMFDPEDTVMPEPKEYPSLEPGSGTQSDLRMKIQAAKQRRDEAEREDIAARGVPKMQFLPSGPQTPALLDPLYDPDEVANEDGILEEMDAVVGELTPSMSTPNLTLLNGFDPSNPSRNAWATHVTAADAPAPPSGPVPDLPKHMAGSGSVDASKPPLMAPPSGALPDLPGPRRPANIIPPPIGEGSVRAFASAITSPGVRERRLSGRKMGNLTINTGTKHDPTDASMAAPKTVAVPQANLSKLSSFEQGEYDEAPKSAGVHEKSFSRELAKPMNLAPLHFELAPDTGSASPGHSHFNRTPLSETKSGQPSAPASPARSVNRPGTASGLRKNFSSTSLKSLKNAVATPTTAEDSPQTPITRLFSGSSQPGHGSVPSVPELPTPGPGHFSRHGVGPGSFSFFNTDIHSLQSPGSPNPAVTNGPAPLEPCPESFLLRPFWLLRCVYQIIANPHGGYLSTRLFVPRDIWKVRNVKLKNVDEKVAQCDMLTAALLKLARADADDADAVLEEMQSFELILDQVQAQLTKKLGTEVGVQNAYQLFKVEEDANVRDVSGRSSSTTGRISSRWKRVMGTKTPSGPPPAAITGGIQGLSKDVRETLIMKSLPMAGGSVLPKKHIKRNPTKVLGVGPHANYMAALARLSDAAQILDQVARQVEDPGLRLSSQTHVGLELCTRHAAEFFAFYVCRFALADINAMLDKFVKRGSEWILN